VFLYSIGWPTDSRLAAARRRRWTPAQIRV